MPSEQPACTRRRRWMLGASGLLAFAAEGMNFAGVEETAWPVVALAAAAILVGGLPTLRKGWSAIRTFTLDIDFLMSIAVLGACAIGAWPEAAMVVFLFAVAEVIESRAVDRARHTLQSLLTLTPTTASVHVDGANGQGEWRQVLATSVAVGSILRVKPGERLPLDGVVIGGSSTVNQAPITGESMAVMKGEGDPVFAGSINETGVLEFRTTGGADQTTIARIVRTVQEAQSQRAPTQRLVDSFARVYTPAVISIAVLVAFGLPLLFAQSMSPWIYRALVLLVIACPCALVISTPVTVVSGLTAAARRGILVKGGVHLENGRRLAIVALDKTGTITVGEPRLTDTVALDRSAMARSNTDLLRIAASLDSLSDHPVARALSTAWNPSAGPLWVVESFESISGRGVTGRIQGESYTLGNHRLAHESGFCSPATESALQLLEAQGKTAIALASSKGTLAVFGVADLPRDTTIAALQELRRMGLRTVMLTGDNQKTADSIARIVGIEDARGELLPEDKLRAIDELLANFGLAAVGMVGDGINDAPALARASIGFSMGLQGTDTAMETADVVFMRDDLRDLPAFIRLSKKASIILQQNIVLAIGIKVTFFILALTGLATLWMAVVADMGASLLVVGNGLRLQGSAQVPRGR